MSKKIQVIQYGMGPIGSAITKLIMQKKHLELVGAVDIDPQKAGKDAGEVLGLEEPLGFPVTKELKRTLDRTSAEVVVHSTNSNFYMFKKQILDILAAGMDVVSTSEELSFPWMRNRENAKELDAAAIQAGKTVLGTGVNPGFLMDTLPLLMTGICEHVDHIEITRRINASTRRGPFQKKIGSGMSEEGFQAKILAGEMGHVGLPESTGMIFDTLGMPLAKYTDEVEPIMAHEPIVTDFFKVEPGEVCGLKQVAKGYNEEGVFLDLIFIAALGMQDEGDTIQIAGSPDLRIELKGTNGDIATRAITVNAIHRVKDARSGLLTMRDIPIITWH